MITAPQAYQTALSAYSRTFKASIQVNGTEIDGDIQTVDVYRGTGSESIMLGATMMPYFTAQVYNLTTALYDAEVDLRVGIMVSGGTFSYITIGKYHITEVNTEANMTTIKGIGSAFWKLQGKNIPTTGSNSPKTLLNDIRTLCGVTILSDFSDSRLDHSIRVAIKRNDEAHTCTEVLGVVAALMGGFVTEDNQGRIVLKEYASGSTATIAADRFLAPPTFNKYIYEITGVKCIIHDNTANQYDPASFETGTVNYIYRCKYMNQDLFNAMANTVIGLSHYPGFLGISLGDPLIDPWDIISTTDINGVVKTIYPLSIHHHIDGGLSTDIDAEMSSSGQSGSLTEAVNSLGANVETATNLAADAQHSADLAQDAADAAQESADAAQESADNAATAAQNAWDHADDAATAAQTAWNHADDAHTAATAAQTAASNAEDAAENAVQQAATATTYANASLDQLGVIQDVIGVLTWAAEHGSFTLTEDVTIQDGKVYFTFDSQTGDYTPVTTPDASHLNEYYELTVNEAMEDYIMSHLAVTGRGLWVLPNGIGSGTTPDTGESQTDSDARQGAGYKTLLANDGMYVYDSTGILVSTFGENIEFNADRPQYIGNNSTFIAFSPANGGTLVINGATINLTNGTLADVLSDLEDNDTATDAAIQSLESASADISQTLNDFKDKYEEYITITTSPASIKLGKNDGATKVEITSSAVNFYTDNNVTAYASGQTFNAYEGKFETVMMQTMGGIGALRWIARSNGHLTLKKVN